MALIRQPRNSASPIFGPDNRSSPGTRAPKSLPDVLDIPDIPDIQDFQDFQDVSDFSDLPDIQESPSSVRQQGIGSGRSAAGGQATPGPPRPSRLPKLRAPARKTAGQIRWWLTAHSSLGLNRNSITFPSPVPLWENLSAILFTR